VLFRLRARRGVAVEGRLSGDLSLGGIISSMWTKGGSLDSVSLMGRFGLVCFGVGARFGGIGVGSTRSGCLVRGREVI
jgi:hypothetical protein